MLMAIKRYCAFTNIGYRFISMFVLPYVLWFLLGIALKRQEAFTIRMYVFGAYGLYLLLDSCFDFWFTGGICTKGGVATFLQGSKRFLAFMKDVMLVDFARRVIWNCGSYGVFFIIGKGNGLFIKELQVLFFVPLLCTFLGQAGVLGLRYLAMFQYVYFGVLGIELIYWLAIGGTFLVKGSVVILSLVLLLFIAGLALLTVKNTSKKMRDSYYD